MFGVSATHNDNISTGLIEACEWLTNTMVADQTSQELGKWMPQLVEHDDNDDTNNIIEVLDKNTPWSIKRLTQSLKGILYKVY